MGNSLIQEVGIGEKSIRQTHHAQLHYFASLKVGPMLAKRGFSVTDDAVLPSGTFLRAAHFQPGQLVDVQATSIGKGFQGAMKKWGFSGMPASHGVSLTHRSVGATGSRSDPGRVFKGKKMPGRMGGKAVTMKRLRILKVDNALNCIMVRGSVPGHDNAVVRITDSTCYRRQYALRKSFPFPTFVPADGEELPREMTAEAFESDPLYVASAEK